MRNKMDIIDHIAIKVSDLKEAEKWYLEHLSAQITFQDHKYTRLRVGNTNIALIDERFYPHAHIGVLVKSKEELPEAGERVQHRDGTIGVYVKDPFGNYIEYIWYSQDQGRTFLK
jgi:extradiol dioxygenase family protein